MTENMTWIDKQTQTLTGYTVYNLTAWRIFFLLIGGLIYSFPFLKFSSASEFDLRVWWLLYLLCAGLIPVLVMAYLLYPAQTQRNRVDQLISRMTHAVQEAGIEDEVQATRESIRETTEYRVDALYHPKNYVLPVIFLMIVLTVGFFLIFSFYEPLAKMSWLGEMILDIPTTVKVGFIGGTFYALFAVVTRYRSTDIPPGLVLQLSFQIVFAAAIAYIASSPAEGFVELAIAFGVGFVPYSDLTQWIRLRAQTRLGIALHEPGPLTRGLGEIQGITPHQRERLSEEGILSVQNLALSNPLVLTLGTTYPVSQIIDWINQASLRIYMSAEMADKLGRLGIRGITDFAKVEGYIDDDNINANERKKFIETIARVLETDSAAVLHFVRQQAKDPKVKLLSLAWNEFGGS